MNYFIYKFTCKFQIFQICQSINIYESIIMFKINLNINITIISIIDIKYQD